MAESAASGSQSGERDRASTVGDSPPKKVRTSLGHGEKRGPEVPVEEREEETLSPSASSGAAGSSLLRLRCFHR